jgi:hypothetical protein
LDIHESSAQNNPIVIKCEILDHTEDFLINSTQDADRLPYA